MPWCPGPVPGNDESAKRLSHAVRRCLTFSGVLYTMPIIGTVRWRLVWPIIGRHTPKAAMRPVRASISLGALRHNLAAARQRSRNARLWAVVKANAYGHGLRRIEPALAAADGLA